MSISMSMSMSMSLTLTTSEMLSKYPTDTHWKNSFPGYFSTRNMNPCKNNPHYSKIYTQHYTKLELQGATQGECNFMKSPNSLQKKKKGGHTHTLTYSFNILLELSCVWNFLLTTPTCMVAAIRSTDRWINSARGNVSLSNKMFTEDRKGRTHKLTSYSFIRLDI